MQGMMTSGEQQQRAADSGLAAALAIAHQVMARECHDFPENLVATPASQYFYATTGTIEERHATVRAWAARHHVPAGWDDNLGYYCARVPLGQSSMIACAVPVLAGAAA